MGRPPRVPVDLVAATKDVKAQSRNDLEVQTALQLHYQKQMISTASAGLSKVIRSTFICP